jgi:hypothetical protein
MPSSIFFFEKSITVAIASMAKNIRYAFKYGDGARVVMLDILRRLDIINGQDG